MGTYALSTRLTGFGFLFGLFLASVVPFSAALAQEWYGDYRNYPYNEGYYTEFYHHYSTKPTCSLTLTYNSSYERGHALLSWSSNNATSAYISPEVGAVSTSGSREVFAPGSQTFRMVVYGQGGTDECFATGGSQYSYPYVSEYTREYPYQYENQYYAHPYPEFMGYTYTGESAYTGSAAVGASYVTLTQIPYTGFDFGPTGNAVYWLTIMLLSAIGAYLLLRYKWSAFRGLEGLVRVQARQHHAREARVLPTLPVLTEETESVTEEKTHGSHTIVAHMPRIAHDTHLAHDVHGMQAHAEVPVSHATLVSHEKPLRDVMSLAQSSGEDMPRIVIQRN